MMAVLENAIRIESHRHQQHFIRAALVGVHWRCSFCGHRLTVNGVPPIETRKKPVWCWLPELIDRQRARQQFAWAALDE